MDIDKILVCVPVLLLCQQSRDNVTTPPQCQVIHDEGVIHNDLKPENFVVMGARLKLIDFGIANKIEEEKTSIQRNMRCGTINYMAPETIETYENEDFFKVSLCLPQTDTSFLGTCPAIWSHLTRLKSWVLFSLGPRPKTNPSVDCFQYRACYTGSDIRAE